MNYDEQIASLAGELEHASAQIAMLQLENARLKATAAQSGSAAQSQTVPERELEAIIKRHTREGRGWDVPDSIDAETIAKEAFELGRAASAAPVAASQATAPTEREALTDARILEIAKDWVKVEGWYEFEKNDFISCVRAALSAPAAAPIQERPNIRLPERVIDCLWQAAGLTTYHPDGDQLDKFIQFAHNVTDEVLARLPAAAPIQEAPAIPEGLRKDAERYRWLRDKADFYREDAPQVVITNWYGEPVSVGREAYPQGEDLDAAIDAAMAAAPLPVTPQTKGDIENEALALLKRLKSNLMHTRRFAPETLQSYRTACTNAEGDIEEFLNSVAEAKQKRYP